MSKSAKSLPGPTNFDVWKESLTPEAIADGKFITLSCGGCPAFGSSCNKHDTNCRLNFLGWARDEAVITPAPTEEVTECET